MTALDVISLVDEGLGNSAYLLDLGDGRALAVDASLDLRALRASARRRTQRPQIQAGIDRQRPAIAEVEQVRRVAEPLVDQRDHIEGSHRVSCRSPGIAHHRTLRHSTE